MTLVTLKSFSFNRSLSEKAARKADARLKQCWSNAYLALRRVSELQAALYVEGWILWRAIPIAVEHGWVEKGREIVDPTRVLWSENYPDVLYFPALRYNLLELQAAIRKPADLPLVHRYGRGGFNNPAYAQAYADTLKASGADVKALSKFLASLPR